jgi:hypothetical protein
MDGALIRQVWRRADDRCEYSRLSQRFDDRAFEIDHIMNRLLEWMGPIGCLVRPLAITAMWLTASVFFVLAYFLSGRSARVEEAIIFAVAFGTAAAVSAVIALAVGGKRRWALDAALPMAILIAAAVSTAGVLTWLASTVSASPRTINYLPVYWGSIAAVVLGVSLQTIPTGAILGAGIGVISGLSIVLGRRWPRLVGWLLVMLLVFCVIGSVHIVAFDGVVDFVVRTRLEGVRPLVGYWGIRHELPSAIGATAGAFVGAVVVYGAVRLVEGSRRSRPNRVTACESLESGSRSGA